MKRRDHANNTPDVRGSQAFRVAGEHLFYGEQLINLTPKEHAVFMTLLQARGLPVVNGELIERVWGLKAVGPESLHRCVSTLRGKLSRHHPGGGLVTHHRVGYSLNITVLQEGAGPPENDADCAAELFGQAIQLATPRTMAGLELAIRRLEQALDVDPDFTPAHSTLKHLSLAQAWHRMRHPREAARACLTMADRAMARDAANADALAVRGFVKAVVDGEEEGFEDLDRAVFVNPRNWYARLYRGWALAGKGMFPPALADLEEASKLNADSAGIIGPYAYVLFIAGEPQQALELLRSTWDTARSSASTQATYAIVASWLNLHEEAIAAGRRAAETLDGSPTMALPLINALARAGLTEEAAETFERIMSEATVPAAASTLSPVFLALGDEQRAADVLKEADAEGCLYRHVYRRDPRIAGLAV